MKVKAHTTQGHVQQGLIIEWERRGNYAADRFAKEGADSHPVAKEDLWMYRGLRMIAHEAAWWTGRLHAHIRACEVRDSKGLPGPQPEQENGSGRPVQRQEPEIVGPEQDGAVGAAAIVGPLLAIFKELRPFVLLCLGHWWHRKRLMLCSLLNCTRE